MGQDSFTMSMLSRMWALCASSLSNIIMMLEREDVPLLVAGICNYDTGLCLEPAVHPLHSQAALRGGATAHWSVCRVSWLVSTSLASKGKIICQNKENNSH